MLQRNLGRIVEIKNTSKLIQYIITTGKPNSSIEEEAPVDCYPDDLESTCSETYDMIVIQTITNVLCATFEMVCVLDTMERN